jgi:hypothetical protein
MHDDPIAQSSLSCGTALGITSFRHRGRPQRQARRIVEADRGALSRRMSWNETISFQHFAVRMNRPRWWRC